MSGQVGGILGAIVGGIAGYVAGGFTINPLVYQYGAMGYSLGPAAGMPALGSGSVLLYSTRHSVGDAQ